MKRCTSPRRPPRQIFELWVVVEEQTLRPRLSFLWCGHQRPIREHLNRDTKRERELDYIWRQQVSATYGFIKLNASLINDNTDSVTWNTSQTRRQSKTGKEATTTRWCDYNAARITRRCQVTLPAIRTHFTRYLTPPTWSFSKAILGVKVKEKKRYVTPYKRHKTPGVHVLCETRSEHSPISMLTYVTYVRF